MQIERVEAFRNEAEEKGLIVQIDDENGKTFFFDLNQGAITAPADRNKVNELVDLARKHAECEEYGEHLALSQLVARKTDLIAMEAAGITEVYWYRPYQVARRVSPDDWITLADWLA